MKLIKPLILFLVLSLNTFASDVDTSFIKQFEEELLCKFSFNNKTEEFRLKGTDNTIVLRPNSQNKLSIYFSHQYLTVGFSLSPSFLPGNGNEDKKGDSRIYDFSTTLKFDHWMQELSFSYIKGFYLANTESFFPDGLPDQNEYYLFPELTYVNFSGYTAYSFNSKYSVKAISSQTEHQLKSAGSFMPLIYYRYYIMDNKEKLTENNSTQKSNNFEMSAQMGYYYTKVIGQRWHIAPGVTAGGGFIHTRLTTRFLDDKIKTQYTNPIIRTTSSLSLGYRTRKWAFGANAVASLEVYPEGDQTTVTNNHVYTEIYLTYRFNTPKIVKETVDMIPMPIK